MPCSKELAAICVITPIRKDNLVYKVEIIFEVIVHNLGNPLINVKSIFRDI